MIQFTNRKRCRGRPKVVLFVLNAECYGQLGLQVPQNKAVHTGAVLHLPTPVLCLERRTASGLDSQQMRDMIIDTKSEEMDNNQRVIAAPVVVNRRQFLEKLCTPNAKKVIAFDKACTTISSAVPSCMNICM